MIDSVEDVQLKRFTEMILANYSYDFRGYAKASLKRRIKTAITQLGEMDFDAFFDQVAKDATFFARVYQYLTVSTTEMFRDPWFYAAFRKEVVPFLRTYPSFRIWIAGCSTGEEFYSYAIILEEEGLLDRATIYATDLNRENLKRVERGVYSMERAKLYSENYLKTGGSSSLSDFYHADYDGIIMDHKLKRNAVFADHCLITDNVFTEAQYVSCRNVLIYFEKQQQERALGLFRDSLSPRGFLGLGTKESLRFSEVGTEFEHIPNTPSIYRRKH